MPYKLSNITTTVSLRGMRAVCYNACMQSSKAKLFTGVLVFVGIIGLGAVVYNFISLYSSMPSREDVMNFASDTLDNLPTADEAVSGSLVPDGGQAGVGTDGQVTTLPTEQSAAPASTDWLTPAQRQVLSTLGIDESALPTTLTPELEACFVTKIGTDRVDAIKGGDTPTLIEGMKAMACL